MRVTPRIDHTLLRAEATADQIRQLCLEARQYGFAAVCVNPVFVRLCADHLSGSSVKVCTVIGFPLGATPTLVKVFEAEQAIRDGAQELDMVLAVGQLKGGAHDYVRQDVQEVVRLAANYQVPVKVILETAALTDEEIRLTCQLCLEAGAAFVKTSTGMHKSGGATARVIRLMRETVGNRMQIKASGGISDLTTAHAMVEAGADRIGTSGGVAIANEEQSAAA